VCYTVKFKLEVARYAQENGNTTAERKSDVDDMNVRWWLGKKENQDRISKKKYALYGKLWMYPHVEAELYQYIMNMQKKTICSINWCLKVADDDWPGRPVDIATEATVKQVEELIQSDWRIMTDSVATALGCSHGLAYSIMHDRLKFQEVCTWWVPRELKDRGKMNQMGLFL
jgi:hypothetical protein